MNGAALVTGLADTGFALPGLEVLPVQLRSQVASLLTGSYKLPPLPFGFKAKSVVVGPSGITVRATTNATVLG